MAPFKRSLVWMRRDLRLRDHRALFEACAQSKEVIPFFLIDETIVKGLPEDDRRIEFIQGCLDDLDTQLSEIGSRMLIRAGRPSDVLPAVCSEYKIDAVFFNHDYEPLTKARDARVSALLTKNKVQVFSFKDQVVFERREILNGSGEPYRVFTPYSKAWLKACEAKRDSALREFKPNLKVLARGIKAKNARFSDLGFMSVELDFKPGERAARKVLKAFQAHVKEYHQARDFPAIDGTSSLSPHFRFGAISIREAVRFCYENFSSGAKVWLSELIWREFYHMILDQFPHVVDHAFKKDYDNLKWEGTPAQFKAWCEGRTGYPIVDAAMRQLNQTGWMHNRLRMVAAMFLTKDLLIDWRKGERYFALKLLDYDLAANNGGWQWSASTGCDAQPYFRVMNPISQSERFDENGDFIRKFVPELKHLDKKQIHWPHDEGLFSSDLNSYPAPIVEHKVQREKAIKMFKK